jgi:hypothetical protein
MVKLMLKSRIHTLFTLCSAILFMGCLLITPAHAQQREAVLEDVMVNWGRKDYNSIIQLLKDNPPAQFPGRTEKIWAYEMLASAYLYTDRSDSAKAILASLITLEPNYRPTTVSPTDVYMNLVEDVKRMLARKKGGSKKWYWIGGAGLTTAVAVTLYFVLRRGEEELPSPPDLPDIRQ